MSQARAVQRAWEGENARPVAPVKQVRMDAEHYAFFEELTEQYPGTHPQQIMDWIRANLPTVADEYDADYRMALVAWEDASFRVLFLAMVQQAVDAESEDAAETLAYILLDREAATDLYWSIISVSELSFVAAWREMDRVGYTYKGMLFTEAYKLRNTSKPLWTLHDPVDEVANRLILKHGGSLQDRLLFDSLDIPTQTQEFARLFVKEWTEAFAIEDAQPKQTMPLHRDGVNA